MGEIAIEASESINEFFVHIFDFVPSKNLAELVNGKCVVVSELRKCVTGIDIIFRISIKWQYISLFDRKHLHQPYLYKHSGNYFEVDPFIGYIGYEGSTEDFTTPVYENYNDHSKINLAFGSVEHELIPLS